MPRVEGSIPGLSISFICSSRREKKRKSTKVSRNEETRRRRRERREEEEEPAGVSGRRVVINGSTSPRGLVCKSGLVNGSNAMQNEDGSIRSRLNG